MKKFLGLVVVFLFSHIAFAENNTYMIEKFDRNGDKVVTQDEFLEAAAQRFKMMDIDGDKAIEKTEFLQRYAEHAHPTTHESAVNVEERVFDKLDENKDLKISEQEYNQARLKWFTEADKNNDQKIEISK